MWTVLWRLVAFGSWLYCVLDAFSYRLKWFWLGCSDSKSQNFRNKELVQGLYKTAVMISVQTDALIRMWSIKYNIEHTIESTAYLGTEDKNGEGRWFATVKFSYHYMLQPMRKSWQSKKILFLKIKLLRWNDFYSQIEQFIITLFRNVKIVFSLKHTPLCYLQLSETIFYSLLRWMNDVAVYIEKPCMMHDATALWNKKSVFFDSHELHSTRDVAVMIV